MKYPEYDSPFELTISDITTQMARSIDEMSWQAVQRVGINVDKEKLLIALKQDAERYREAYANGYDTGYEKRDDEIVRCKDCRHATMTSDGKMCKYCAMDTDDFGDQREVYHDADWFCAGGERKSADEILMEKMDADPLG